MKKNFKYFLLFFKMFLLLISFALCTYISIAMSYRLGNDLFSNILFLVPFIILLVIFVLNLIFKQDKIINNLFYNLTCILTFVVIIFVSLRAIFDKSMILNEVMGYGINFSYFSDSVVFMNVMLYGLIISNLIFMINKKSNG